MVPRKQQPMRALQISHFVTQQKIKKWGSAKKTIKYFPQNILEHPDYFENKKNENQF